MKHIDHIVAELIKTHQIDIKQAWAIGSAVRFCAWHLREQSPEAHLDFERRYSHAAIAALAELVAEQPASETR